MYLLRPQGETYDEASDHVERTDPARYHFRKPYKCPRCHARGHALCHAPKIHTHLHEGLLDVVIRIARQ